MRVLVTGSRGLLGRHLVEALWRRPGTEVIGVTRERPRDGCEVLCDLTDRKAVKELMTRVHPEVVFHLAGSFSNEFEIDLRDNVLAAGNLFQSIAESGLGVRVVVTGSAAEYGLVKESDNPIREDHPANPASVYGLTKLYQTELSLFHERMKGLDVVVARIFNVLGSGASEKLFVGRVETQIRAYMEGAATCVNVGNLEAFRDYISVDEATRTLIKLMRVGSAGNIYNVGSGVPTKMRTILDRMLEEAGLDWSIVKCAPERSQDKPDVPIIYADVAKLRSLESES